MVRDQSSNQTVLDFYLPFGGKLSSENRWVKLAEIIPWDELGSVYNSNFHPTMGAPATPSRVVIGAMILKHMKNLSDEEVIEDIRENPYCQYFLGFQDFQDRTVFVPSLFVEIRKRLGMEQLQEINELFLSKISEEDQEANVSEEDPEEIRRGMLIMDASVAPSDIRYPTDVDLLNTAREKAEDLVDELWSPGTIGIKPRTYRQVARKKYLAFTHQRKPGKKKIRKAIGQQLGYLRRDLKHINDLLDEQSTSFLCSSGNITLSFRQQRTLWVISELYRQQQWMHDHHTHAIGNRIVSIAQPYVRPIVRGKAGKRTEFGAKLSGVVIDGNVYLDNLNWDAYNESSDMKGAVEKYRKRFGFYPESVNADKIYWSRDNRRYLKEKNISMYGGAPLGRPKKIDELSPEEKREHKEKSKRRNWIEGKFGEGKRRYGLGLVMAKTRVTSESWIAMVIFVMNIARVFRDLFLSPLFWLVQATFKQISWSIWNETIHEKNYKSQAGLWGGPA
jgi:transposase, IS5 family